MNADAETPDATEPAGRDQHLNSICRGEDPRDARRETSITLNSPALAATNAELPTYSLLLTLPTRRVRSVFREREATNRLPVTK